MVPGVFPGRLELLGDGKLCLRHVQRQAAAGRLAASLATDLSADLAAIALLLTIDSSFFLATSTKIVHGGWFPLLIGMVMFMLMTTWKDGRALLSERLRSDAIEAELGFTEGPMIHADDLAVSA